MGLGEHFLRRKQSSVCSKVSAAKRPMNMLNFVGVEAEITSVRKADFVSATQRYRVEGCLYEKCVSFEI